MKTLTKFSAIAAIAAITVSCNKQECHNTNPVFDTTEPSSAEYKKELIKYLDKKGTYTYTFTQYEEGDIPSFLIDIKGADICAEATIFVPSADQTAEKLIKNKGTGYYGAEFENLKIELDTTKNILVYRSADDIID